MLVRPLIIIIIIVGTPCCSRKGILKTDATSSITHKRYNNNKTTKTSVWKSFSHTTGSFVLGICVSEGLYKREYPGRIGVYVYTWLGRQVGQVVAFPSSSVFLTLFSSNSCFPPRGKVVLFSLSTVLLALLSLCP